MGRYEHIAAPGTGTTFAIVGKHSRSSYMSIPRIFIGLYKKTDT